MKHTLLLMTGINDYLLREDSSQFINKKEELINTVTNILTEKTYKGVIEVNHSRSYARTDKLDVTKHLSPQSIIKYAYEDGGLYSANNKLTITSLDNEALVFDASMFTFLFPTDEYDIHMCGIDINGSFKDMLSELLLSNYKVTVYSDAIRPFKNTYKYINSLTPENTNKLFNYCSFRSV